jgi:glucose-6-phosphate isomerase
VKGLQKIRDAGAVARLWAKDGTLFSKDPDVAAQVGGALGWVGLAASAAKAAPALNEAAAAIRESGVTDIVLLGMGGSSLAPLVMSRLLPLAAGSPRLHVLDTTSPYPVARALETLGPRTTLVVVSSKSGTTIEPLSLYAVFREWADKEMGAAAGSRFIAVTDPGSPLEKLASEEGFAAVFHGAADVGGRFSALTAFGLVPAALAGVDVAAVAASAAAMETACRAEAGKNPGAMLAAWMADAAVLGRDKLTFVTSPALAPFGLWIEQLVAESTGKGGKGIVPVLEPDAQPESWGDDRMVFLMREANDAGVAVVTARAPAGTPISEVVISDAADIGAEFVRWEFATALVGLVLGVNPFDQPDVAEAKRATSDILAGTLSAPEPTMHLGDIELTASFAASTPSDTASLASMLDTLLDGAGPGSYLALLTYLPEEREIVEPLTDALAALARARKLACTLEMGPRYLHSTGQLHKAGPPTGRFIILTARDEPEVPVPGADLTLRRLVRAQAEGDYVTLAGLGRPVLRIDLPQPAHAPVRLVAETLRGAVPGA